MCTVDDVKTQTELEMIRIRKLGDGEIEWYLFDESKCRMLRQMIVLGIVVKVNSGESCGDIVEDSWEVLSRLWDTFFFSGWKRNDYWELCLDVELPKDCEKERITVSGTYSDIKVCVDGKPVKTEIHMGIPNIIELVARKTNWTEALIDLRKRDRYYEALEKGIREHLQEEEGGKRKRRRRRKCR